MRITRRGFFQSTAAGAASAALFGCGGSDTCEPATGKGCTPSLPDGSYFAQLAQDLTAAGIGSPHILIDLDRLDANADAIVAGAGQNRNRLFEKSLPSLHLLSYLSTRTGSNRVMVLHLPFLPVILGGLPMAQVLVGKPQPTAAVNQFFQAFPPGQWPALAQRVVFLADTEKRADDLAMLASTLGVTLQAGVEIDVGLHRGGVRKPSGLPAVLAKFAANPQLLSFGGMLGYDAQVANAPAAPGLEEQTAREQWKTATATYREFVDVLETQFPMLVRDDLIFNSGGSATYPIY